MDYFVYKSAKISLFQPEGSVSQGFTFPEKLKPLLKGKPSPIIYIFEKEPTFNLLEGGSIILKADQFLLFFFFKSSIIFKIKKL